MLKFPLEEKYFSQEYGITLRRVYPNQEENLSPPFSSAWGIVDVNAYSKPHAHAEGETFFISSGEGTMHIDQEETLVTAGDTIYIPSGSEHWIENTTERPLFFVSVWWEPGEGVGD